MSKQNSGFTGSCLCGQVKYVSKLDPVLAGHCHCTACRKTGGSGHTTNIAVPKEGFSVSGPVKFYDDVADSGVIVSRGFCSHCGSPVYSKNANMPDMVFPKASSLDDPEIITPSLVVYASRAPSWDFVDPSLPSFAEMPQQRPADMIEAAQNKD